MTYNCYSLKLDDGNEFAVLNRTGEGFYVVSLYGDNFGTVHFRGSYEECKEYVNKQWEACRASLY